jgi:hypothetical protein
LALAEPDISGLWPRCQSSTCTPGYRGLASARCVERITGFEPALSAWEAGEPTSQVVFSGTDVTVWGPFGGLSGGVGARGAPSIGQAECVLLGFYVGLPAFESPPSSSLPAGQGEAG